MLARLLCLAALLLPVGALAQAMGEKAKTCVPNGAPPGAEYERGNQTREWPEEAQRFRSDAPNVARQGDRLRLAIDGGKSVDLQDCPYGDSAYQFLYERFDDPGRFYVVRTPAHEDFFLHAGDEADGPVVHGLWRAGLDPGQVEILDSRLLFAAGARCRHDTGAVGRRIGHGSGDPAAVRLGKLLGALGLPVVDIGVVHAARRA